VFAPHIGEEHGGFIAPTLMTKPDVVLVWTLGDGQLGLCTYNSLQEVRAWHRWSTDGFILSACAMPDGKNADRLYLVVKRVAKDDSGIDVDESYAIEVIDKDSEYVDNGNRDYVSTMITNPLFAVVQERVSKRNENNFYIRFGSPFDYRNNSLQVSVDGGNVWRCPDWEERNVSGWMDARSDVTWQFEKQVGIRVQGNCSCHILGIQG
jgi:hypothetical protein